ncbi:uncharacterized protein LOC126772375 [Nymphalis io]|uniref:uncharacterized protein LOC126772375 n=1 Tax=Inachis io TaxID=171585 RepID=UPI0021687A71|nr:uncharacterized protein LOC126772375 [Nymphalis io]
MLCPEVWNFPPPKVITSYKKCANLETVISAVERNCFYKSAIVTCPDELHTPQQIADILLEDNDYYTVFNCSLTEFLEPIFIQNFVKAGKLYCLTADTNCIVQNCAAITPDGVLTLNILDSIYQTLGLEGNKCSHSYYQIKVNLIDLTRLKIVERTRKALSKIKSFNFYVSWEPDKINICPSSIAKYFCDRNFEVSCHSLEVQKITPDVREIPTLIDCEIEEIVEWIGMLAHGAELWPTEGYVSSYSEPECASPLQSSRISLLIIKGFLTPNILSNACKSLADYVESRELKDYWSSISIQSVEDSLWQWSTSSPKMFQPQNTSCNFFFSQGGCTMYSIGQLKYS